MDCFYAAVLKRKTESFSQRLGKITKNKKKFCMSVCVSCVYVYASAHVCIV